MTGGGPRAAALSTDDASFHPTAIVTLAIGDGDLARRRDGFRLDVRSGRLWSAGDRHRARAGVAAARAALAAAEAVEEPEDGGAALEAAQAALEDARATAAQLVPDGGAAAGEAGEDGEGGGGGAVLVRRPEDRGAALVALRGRYRAERPRPAWWARRANAACVFIDALQSPTARSTFSRSTFTHWG